MVDEHLLEVVRTNAPVLLQVQRQVRRHDLATAVTHVARSIELAHTRIHDWHTRVACLPPENQVSIRAPALDPVLTRLADARQPKNLALVRLAVKVKEVADPQLKHQVLCRLVLHRKGDHLVVDPSR